MHGPRYLQACEGWKHTISKDDVLFMSTGPWLYGWGVTAGGKDGGCRRSLESASMMRRLSLLRSHPLATWRLNTCSPSNFVSEPSTHPPESRGPVTARIASTPRRTSNWRGRQQTSPSCFSRTRHEPRATNVAHIRLRVKPARKVLVLALRVYESL